MPKILHLRATTPPARFQWLSAPGLSALAILLIQGCEARQLDGPTLVHIADANGTVLDQAMACKHGSGLLLTCHGGAAVRAAVQNDLLAAGFTPEILPAFGHNRFEALTLSLLADAQGAAAVTMTLDAAGRGRTFRDALSADIQRVLKVTANARYLYEPPRVQLWGPVNSGKSSLLNALCESELAATGPEPGLTRDVIEGRVEHDGFVLRLFDAPGTWHGTTGLDQRALQLAELWKARADLVLTLEPGTEDLDPEGWVIHSRADETRSAQPAVSVHDAPSLARLKDRLVEHFFGPLRRLSAAERYLLHPELREELAAGALAEVRTRWLD